MSKYRYSHWFVSRQKRQLTMILQALLAFSDICLGKEWTRELQLDFENELGARGIIAHGKLRARREGSGGGGTRTLFKQMKDLGLVFLEDENRKCRLTLIGQELVLGRIGFVEAMRLQLKRYQYPSAAVWSGSGSVDHKFRIHPFQFMFRLLRDPRLGNLLTMNEMYGIVIHNATSDSQQIFENVVSLILKYRDGLTSVAVKDDKNKTFSNIANTFFNYISLTQFTDRGTGTISIRAGKEKDADAFIESDPTWIKHPDLQENYQRQFGRGYAAKDHRNFDKEEKITQKEINEKRMLHEFLRQTLETPVSKITKDIVSAVSLATGIDEKKVEKYLLKNCSQSHLNEFFLHYRELANMGQAGARDFELATCEMFRKIFGMKAEHVGAIGNTPDVYVESGAVGYCGIIDNKAYKNGYSISGDHKRRMEDVYVKNYKEYGKTRLPLAFFSYIAGSFGTNINNQLAEITRNTSIPGSAMPVDIFINMAQDYAESGHDHQFLKRIFSLGREVRLADIN